MGSVGSRGIAWDRARRYDARVDDNTTEATPIDVAEGPKITPGIIVVLEAGKPVNRVIEWRDHTIILGREQTGDPQMSREHASFEYLGDHRWRIAELGSTNHTHIDGRELARGAVSIEGKSIVVRMGGTIVLLDTAMWRYSVAKFTHDNTHVISPRVGIEHHVIQNLARAGRATLIRGESGTGKELAARVYHQASRNARGPFENVDAGAITDTLAESLLFGAVKGVGTGVEAQTGHLEKAHKGTLYFDELGNMPYDLQGKLLRALQEKIIQPLGAKQPRKVDFQLVCASNANFEEKLAAGTFRRDFYARIGEGVVHLPPLAERKEEIPFLIDLFLRGTGFRVRPTFVEKCMLRSWPENVRGLRNALMTLVARYKVFGASELNAEHLASLEAGAPSEPPPPPRARIIKAAKPPTDNPKWPDVQRFYLEFRDAKKAAELAGVSTSSAHRWLVKAGLIERRPDDEDDDD